MATSINQGAIQQLYVAFFNRPADPAGLAYWEGQLPSNTPATSAQLNAIAGYFNSSTEYQALYLNDSNSQIVNALYLNLFGRPASATENAYWTNLLNTGAESFASIAMDVAGGAQNNDATVLGLKVTAADAFTSSIVTNSQLTGYSGDTATTLARQWLATVVDPASEAAATTPSALNQAVYYASLGGTPTNSTFTLTDGVISSSPQTVTYTPPNSETSITTTEQVSNPGILSSTPPGPAVLTWSATCGSTGIPVTQLESFLQTITGLTFAQLGIITAGPEASQPVSISIGNITSGSSTTGGDSTIKITLGNGQVVSTVAALASDYFTFLNSLLYNADGSSRLSMVTPSGTTVSYPVNHIVLTPSQNNGGTVEAGVTTAGNDTIVVGRADLLMGAYIDGGTGYNTLQVEMKGVYAQPLELLNIQEVDVENMPHLYTNADGSTSYPAVTNTGTGGASYLDLSNALSLQKLVITEGQPFVGPAGNVIAIGALNVIGIQGSSVVDGVTVQTHILLEGGFTQNVNLSYGLGQTGDVNLDLQLGYTAPGFQINIANSATVLNIDSMGYANTFSMCTSNFNGQLSRINVSGTGILDIVSDLSGNFAIGSANHPATIDATANTGGVVLELDQSYVKFLGSQAADTFTATNSSVVTIISTNSADNTFTTDGSTTVNITSGNGNDTISAQNGVNVTINAGAGNNIINADNAINQVTRDLVNYSGSQTLNNHSVNITTGGGDDTISALHNNVVTINAGNGNNTIDTSGNTINITTGTGNDHITISGETPNCSFYSDDTNNIRDLRVDGMGALLNINTGSGNDTIVLGDSTLGRDSGVIAMPGSVITGTNITLSVVEDSDLSNASLTGITSVVLSHDLTLNVTQFEAIGAAAFSVNNAVFGNTANLDLVITANTDLSTPAMQAALANLSPNVRLNFDILNGATLTLTAQELSTYVAPNGVNSTDGLNGNVVITNAGTNFNAFNNGPNFSVIDTGSLSSHFAESTGVTVQRVPDALGGFERPSPITSTDTLTIDSTAAPVTIGTSINDTSSGNAVTLSIVGSHNVVFNPGVTVNLPVTPAQNHHGTPIGSAIDFSTLTGTVTGLTVANFNQITSVKGNDTAANHNFTTIDVQLTGDVGAPGNTNGLHTSGVSEYLVTSIVDGGNAFGGNSATFYLCDSSLGVQVLGLQGNGGNTITFAQVPWGAVSPTFLLQGDGYANWNQGPKSDLQPNEARIGTLVVDFSELQGAGAPAVVNINNGGTALGVTSTGGPRPIVVDGIDLHNAGALTVNVTDGNAIIGGIVDNATVGLFTEASPLTTLTLISVATATETGSLTVDGSLPLNLTTINTTGVAGLFTATIGDGTPGDLTTPFNFTGGAGGVNLTLDAVTAPAGTHIDGGTGLAQLTVQGAVDLNQATLSHVGNVVLDNHSSLTLNFGEFNSITAPHIAVDATGDTATLNLVGLDGSAAFGVPPLNPGITIGDITLASQPIVNLAATATNLTGVAGLIVPDGTTLTLTAAQFMELGAAGIAGSGLATEGTVNITGVTQAEINVGLNLSGINGVHFGTVTLDPAATQVNLENVAGVATSLGGFTHFVLAADQTLGIASETQLGASAPIPGGHSYAGLTVDNGTPGGVAAGSAIELLFSALGSQFDLINASNFNVAALKVLNSLFTTPLNAGLAFSGLPSATLLEIYNDLGFVTPINRLVQVDAGTTVLGSTVFNAIPNTSEIANLTLTLAGGVELVQNLRLSTTDQTGNLVALGFQTLTINSQGTAQNIGTHNTANIIDGIITPFGTGSQPGYTSVNNDMLNVVINATQALVVNGGIIFNSVGTAVPSSLTATANLTIATGSTANVTLGVLDAEKANNVTTLDVVNNGTGHLSLALNDTSAGVNLSFTGAAGSNTQLIIAPDAVGVNSTVDLSADILTGVTHITIDNANTLTLSEAQFNALGAANIQLDATTHTATLDIVGLGSAPLDVTALETGISVHSVTLAPGSITLDAATNLTGVSQIIVQEGGSLTLTATQFQELSGTGSIIGAAGTDPTNYTVHITGLTQANVDYNVAGDTAGLNLSGITAAHLDVTLGQPSVVLGTVDALGNITHESVVQGANADASFILATGQSLSLTNSTQADHLPVNAATGATNTTLVYMFDAIDAGSATPNSIDASGYHVTTLKTVGTFVGGTNVETLIQNLPGAVTVDIYNSPSDLGYVTQIDRTVTVDATTTVPGFLVFNNTTGSGEIHQLSLNLSGTSEINGDLNLSTVPAGSGNPSALLYNNLNSLVIDSTGTGTNTITGNIDGLAPLASMVVPPAIGGAAFTENNVLNVNIGGTQAFVAGVYTAVGIDPYGQHVSGGDIVFTSVDPIQTTATLTNTNTGTVTLHSLDISGASLDGIYSGNNVPIQTLNVINNGGPLNITGGTPAFVADNTLADHTQTLKLSGTGVITFGADVAAGTTGSISGQDLSVIDASGLSGNLALGTIDNIDQSNFTFTSGTGVTTLTLENVTLNEGVIPANTGWSFDLSHAAAGSVITIDTTSTFDAGSLKINLGANATLDIVNPNPSTPTVLDLTHVAAAITAAGAPNIVLGAGVTLDLTAAEASGLHIVAAPGIITDPTNAHYNAALVPHVNIIDLSTQAVDFSGIDAHVAGTVSLLTNAQAGVLGATGSTPTVNPAGADVTLAAATNLGSFTVNLLNLDSTPPGANGEGTDLSGQTIRFATVAQAQHTITVTPEPVDTAGQAFYNAANGLNPALVPGDISSSNVVWLFNSVTGPVNTNGYDANIGRLWFQPSLVNGANVEALFTSLPAQIQRVDFSTLVTLNNLLSSHGNNPVVELVAFTSLPLGLTFSDTNLGLTPSHNQNLTIDMGGQVNAGALVLNNMVPAGVDPTTVTFTALTINSERLDGTTAGVTATAILTPQGFNPALDQYPTALNTIGNISSGAGLDLMAVNLNTGTAGVVGGLEGAALQVGTISFSDQIPANFTGTNATLNVTGANNITIHSLDTTDTHITSLTVDTAGFTGILAVTGGTPAFTSATTGALVIENGGLATGTVTFGSAETVPFATPSGVYAGIADPHLRLINASGFGGTLNLGVLAQIDGTDTTAIPAGVIGAGQTNAFDFISGTGMTTLTLGAADVVGDVAPSLAAGSTWNFDLSNAAAGSELTITNAVTLGAGTLDLELGANAALTISGHVDFTTLAALNITAVGAVAPIIDIPAGSTLTLTADQASHLAITGTGTLDLVGTYHVGDDLSHLSVQTIDLSGITTLGAGAANVLLTVATGATVASAAYNYTVNGSPLVDVISTAGGTGTDTINGGLGSNTLTGGGLSTTFNVANAATQVDTITNLQGVTGIGTAADVLKVAAASSVNATVDANWTATAATINNDATAGAAVLNVNAGVNVDLSAVTTGNGYTINTNAGGVGSTIVGSKFADIINSNNSDTLTGGGGVDTFHVNNAGGTTTITDLSGVAALADVLTVAAGSNVNATVTANFTATAATVNNGGDVNLFLNNGINADLSLAKGNTGYNFTVGNTLGALNALGSTIVGSAFNDVFNGGLGNDTFSGGLGSNTYTAGVNGLGARVGTDTFNVANNTALTLNTDIITNLGGSDVLTVAALGVVTATVAINYTATAATTNASVAANAVTLNLANGINADLSAVTTGAAGYIITAAGNALGSHITGSAKADILTGSLTGTNVITGGLGGDTLNSGGGINTFNVTAGTATINGFNLGSLGTAITQDALAVSAGAIANTTVVNNFVATAATSNAGTANLYLANGVNADLSLATGPNGYNIAAEHLVGGIETANTLGSIITGSTLGGDTLTGGVGAAANNTYHVIGGTDHITNLGAGTLGDVLTVAAGATADAEVTANWTATAATTNAGIANLTVDSGINADLHLATLSGTLGYNILVAPGSVVGSTIVGSGGNDVITGGTSGADILSGGGGVDLFHVLNGGNDTIALPVADSYTVAAGGTALINLGTGTYLANNGNTAVSNGNTTVDLNASQGLGADFTNEGGTTGTLTIVGTAGADTIVGSLRADTIIGGAGADIISLAFGHTGQQTITYNGLNQGGAALSAVAGALAPGDTVSNFSSLLDLIDVSAATNGAHAVTSGVLVNNWNIGNDSVFLDTATNLAGAAPTAAGVAALIGNINASASAVGMVAILTNVGSNVYDLFEVNTAAAHAGTGLAAADTISLVGTITTTAVLSVGNFHA